MVEVPEYEHAQPKAITSGSSKSESKRMRAYVNFLANSSRTARVAQTSSKAHI